MRALVSMVGLPWAVALLIGILLNSPPSAVADTDPTDASVLRGLFSSLNSPQQLTKWTANGGDPCVESWKGVSCSGNRVTEIQISGLALTGSMGFQLDQLKSVTTFDISNNLLGNSLPYQLPPNVQKLNLAGNGFTGGLPYSISQMAPLEYLNVSHNQLQGEVTVMFVSLTNLSTLDFSFNSLAGNIPQTFSSLTNMKNMYLENNVFTGTIDVLATLPLDNLNVENNHFTGWIPSQLQGINSLQTGGNSWNTGPAPPPPPGTPPANRPNHRSGGGSSPSNGGGSDNGGGGGGGGGKSGIGGGAVAGIVISILIIGAIAAFFIIKRRSRRTSTDIEKVNNNQQYPPLVSHKVQEMKSVQTSSAMGTKTVEMPVEVNLRPPPIDRPKSFDEDDISPKPVVTPKKIDTSQINATQYTVADLQIATDSFSIENLLGEGSIGRVYRAQFEDGKVLAVKKINSTAIGNPEDFLDIVSEISRLHHPNVTMLVGYCSEHRQYLLAYEFYKNGSLHDLLHLSDEYTKPLTWNNRVKIALGAARALEYLHEVCSPSVVHKNFKSANILLDSEFNPHLSDSGLASLIPDEDQALNQNSASGYGAPEVAMSGQYTIKSDVYSFGVAMLELLTGRTPFDSSRPRPEQSLVRWATPQLHDIDALSKMVDPALKGLYPVKSLSRFADVIALCVQPEPEFRPPMSEVVEALVRLVQRANMSRRTFGADSRTRSGSADSQEYEL
ncbi:protein STRUBBELIG-RECEPTOR FAMILY 7-like [Ipomoea triloba]|uniref:protein STRUBBELIG-RECEPTOR FAMILY 7-like n=1 Tax=Ipomoea triloba TaxID=35885 RepID=UPI00125E3620|nr:protein STRUBBELIG-RECEPTOR FAMILY 7-like [Ipomoea triloba]